MALVLLTLGLIAERLAPLGDLHTIGQIDVFVAVVMVVLGVFVMLAKLVSDA